MLSSESFSSMSPSIESFLSLDLIRKINETSPTCERNNEDTDNMNEIIENFISHSCNKKHNNKLVKERRGDWVCLVCNNLNFSFRTICNRCHRKKSECTKVKTNK